MALIDFILNAAALLLWVNWRSLGMPAAIPAQGISLASTLRRAETRPVHRWRYFAALVTLLLLRPLLYWFMGGAVNWTAHLELGAVSLHFRADFFNRIALYSLLSFVWWLLVFYYSLLLLAALNHKLPDSDAWSRLVRLHLWPFGRWPWPVQLLLPSLSAALLWCLLSPLLARMNILVPARSNLHLAQQAGVMALVALLAWKYLLMGALFLHSVNSYVYLGNHAFWGYVKATAKQILWPVGFLPLTFFKIDFAPLLGVVAIWFAAKYGALGLTHLYARLPL
ncbi:MAG TPA: hypothetical protein VHH73_12095 [Verrucomicrobiae bacterium]|nr:hypothetical protein [Verrucomicrobiae bacterium]